MARQRLFTVQCSIVIGFSEAFSSKYTIKRQRQGIVGSRANGSTLVWSKEKECLSV